MEYKKGNPSPIKKYQLKGTVNVTNPSKSGIEVSKVVVQLSRGTAAAPINVTASCPAGSGKKFKLAPAPDAGVSCRWAECCHIFIPGEGVRIARYIDDGEDDRLGVQLIGVTGGPRPADCRAC